MQRVCEVYQKQRLPGVSTAYIYRTYISPQFHISIATLYIYLGTPVAKELKNIAARDQGVKGSGDQGIKGSGDQGIKQLSIFNTPI